MFRMFCDPSYQKQSPTSTRFSFCCSLQFFPSPTSEMEKSLHASDGSFLHDKNQTIPKLIHSWTLNNWQRKEIMYHRACQNGQLALALSYQLAKQLVIIFLKGHSARPVAASIGLLRGIQLTNISKAATWLQPSTFIKHYRLDVRAKLDAAFRTAVFSCVSMTSHQPETMKKVRIDYLPVTGSLSGHL